MSTRVYETKDEVITEHFRWFIRKSLSYIDITVDDPVDTKDKHPRKSVLKNLFEDDIYECQRKIIALGDKEFSKDKLVALFSSLMESLVNYSVAAIPDKRRLNTFNKLVADAADQTIKSILADIKN